MRIGTLFKKAIYKAIKLSGHVSDRIHRLAISTNVNVDLPRSCRIDRTAKIETKFGGSVTVGENTEILEGVLVQTYGGRISIGSNCSINPYSIIYGHGNTTIGNNVLIAGGCMIIPSNHAFSDVSIPIIEQPNISKGIVIEDDVWLGHGCSILDNVTIGKGSVIAAGSVVNRSIPAFSVAGGVPAKVIKTRG